MVFMIKNLFVPKNLVVGSGFALLFLLFFWFRSRTFKDRLAMRSFGLKLFLYGALFVIGEGYLMVLFADLKWPRIVLYLAIASWGVLLSPGPWSRRLRSKDDSDVARK
jgi:hypothetical protein